MADVTVSVTGLQAIVNPTKWNAARMGWGQGTYNIGGYVDENILQGWGHVAWGQADWGESDVYDTGWGRDTWSSQVWGGTYNVIVQPSGVGSTTSIGSVTPVISHTAELTGLESTSSIGSPTIDVSVSYSLTGIAATSSVGSITPVDQVMGLTGQEATTSLGQIGGPIAWGKVEPSQGGSWSQRTSTQSGSWSKKTPTQGGSWSKRTA